VIWNVISDDGKGRDTMRHSFLGIALVIFLVWLVLVLLGQALGWIIHLLWIFIVLALIWWLLTAVFGRGRRRRMW
jgi:hypothetical protein